MTRYEAERVYEGLFMRSITALEAFFEEFFFEVVLGRTDHPTTRAKARVDFRSRAVLREFVFAGRDYVDWLPFKAVEDRACVYLRAGRPFTDLTDGQRSQIKQWHLLRNAVAHPGPWAQGQFKKKVVGNMTLLPYEKTPAGFLRSQPQPGRRRLEMMLSDMRRIGSDLSP